MTTHIMLSTPALILTIGHSMLPAMLDVERMYFQSNERRRMITRFLALSLHARAGDAEWTPLKEMLTTKSSSWKEMYERAQVSIEPLKVGIRSSLHELRSHEKLIEAGLGGKTALPLDVYLVADLAETDTAALLLLVPALQSLLADEPYAVLHLLLNIAVFEEEPNSRMNVHVSLNNLRACLQSQDRFHLPQIYLFDRLKEGVWEAQDALEVQTILGNFLLALLSGGLAQHIAHQRSQADIEQYQAYFCGASAALIALDMEHLQKACALRLGREIIENEFQSRVNPNPALIEGMAVNFLGEHANADLWRLRLSQDTLFHASSGWQRFELHIHDLPFEDVPMEAWARTIQAYDETFKTRQLLAQYETVRKNSMELDQEFRRQILKYAQSLPRQVNLYPGGVRAARLILEKIRRDLPLGSQGLPEESRVERVEEEWNAPIQTSLEWLDSAIGKLPKPPRWVMRLPGFLKKPAIQLFNLIYLHRDLKRITDLREASLRLLEKKYAALMEAKVDQVLSELNQGWGIVLDKQTRAVKRLQSLLDKLYTSLEEETTEVTSASSLFRLSAWNETTFEWAYYQGKRPPSGFRHSLLSDWDLFRDWQNMSSKTLEARLMKFCQDTYRNVADLDLDGVLGHRNGRDASDLASALSQGAIPLLRPNFDQTGSGPSYQMRFFLSRDPRESSLLPLIKNDMQEWQEISTGDPYLTICCRVRVMLSFESLCHLFERGRDDYAALEDETKKLYFLMENQ